MYTDSFFFTGCLSLIKLLFVILIPGPCAHLASWSDINSVSVAFTHRILVHVHVNVYMYFSSCIHVSVCVYQFMFACISVHNGPLSCKKKCLQVHLPVDVLEVDLFTC